MKKLLVASIVAIGCALSAASPGEAATVKVKVYLGIPHYTYRVGPDYVYRKGHGWYRPAGRKVSCERARSLVKNRGYRNVDRIECNGGTYTFRGSKSGKRYVVYVNARTGGVSR